MGLIISGVLKTKNLGPLIKRMSPCESGGGVLIRIDAKARHFVVIFSLSERMGRDCLRAC